MNNGTGGTTLRSEKKHFGPPEGTDYGGTDGTDLEVAGAYRFLSLSLSLSLSFFHPLRAEPVPPVPPEVRPAGA